MIKSIPKPKPPEKSRTKGGRQRRSDKKWKVSEREAARFFQDATGVDPHPPVQPSSTGRVGHLLRYDATSAKYIVEVKRRKLPTWLHEAMVQLIQLAQQRGNRHQVLVLSPCDSQDEFVYNGKRYRVPDFHVISKERHAELLAIEASQAEQRPITREDILTLVEITSESTTDAAAA